MPRVNSSSRVVRYNPLRYGHGFRALGHAARSMYRAGRAVRHMFRSGNNLMRSRHSTGTQASPKMKEAEVQTERRRYYRTTGRYRGRFKRPKKFKFGIYDKHAQKGMVMNFEANGTVSDPDCVYVGTAVQDSAQTLKALCVSLFRKMLEEGLGIVIDSPSTVIPTTSLVGEAARTVFTVYYKDIETGALTTAGTYSLAVAATLNDIYTSLGGLFLTYSSQAGYGATANKTQLYSINLMTYDNATSSILQNRCVYKFEELYGVVNVSTTIKVQNRTLAADASADSTDVSNMPLHGRSYIFNGMPKARNGGAYVIEVSKNINREGVILGRAQDMDICYKEPPLASFFSNCKKIARASLQPGEVKSLKKTFYKRMNFLALLRYLRVNEDQNDYYFYNPGPTIMFSFEEIVNVHGIQNISCAYEVNRKIGVHIVRNKKHVMLADFTALTYTV